MYCCGTSGGTAQQGYIYRNIDLYKYNPDYVSIMFGINDIGPSLYSDNAEKDMIEERKKRFDDYKYYMRSLIDDMMDRGITVNLCTPMPYDSGVVTNEGENYHACSEAIENCAEFVRDISKEYGIDYIDFNTVVTKINKDIQKYSPEVSLISNDRIHPNNVGYDVMARIYLNSQGFSDIYVPTIEDILVKNVLPLEIDEKILERGKIEAGLRRLYSVEWMKIVQNDMSRINDSIDKMVEIMRTYELEMKDDASEYFKISIPFYIENKSRQNEFFKRIIDITDCIVSKS